jgi:RES domain-containing protein
VYTLMAGSRVYGGRWLPRLARAVLLTLMYMTLLVVTLAAAWLLALVA